MSGIYSPVVQQLVRDYLADPSTPKPAGSHLAELSSTSKWDVDAIYKDIKQYHWRTWIDYVNRREGEGARDLRASIHKINPKCRIFRYGHPMPCANNYIGLDFCRIGGKDFVADNITEDIMAFEGYFLDHHHSINRSMATMALQKMVCPRILIVEDNEGDIPCTADGQNRAAWPPNGIPVLRRGFQTKAMLLQGLSTIYFDGRQFHRAWDNMYRALYFVPERWRELIEAARVIRQVGPLDRPVSTVAFAWSWDAIRAYDFLWWGDPENSEHPYNPADENLVFAGEEVPRAGVVGGFVCRLDDIENLPACDTLVLPPLKGVKPALIEAIRKKHAQGVHLVGFQDVFGLEDLFGIEPVKDGGKIDSLAPADNPLARKLTAGIPEREVHYWGKCNRVGYRVKEATAILDARDESGRVIGPALVVMKSGKQAANAFWAVPPTDVWREDLSGWNISGETMSKLVKYLMGRVVREIATPPVTTSAGEVLAQWGTDGKLYVLSYENAYPEPSAPLIRPVVSINLPGIDKADVQCERAFEIVERSPGKLSLMTSLEPEAFALYVITPKGGMTKSKSKWTNIFGR